MGMKRIIGVETESPYKSDRKHCGELANVPRPGEEAESRVRCGTADGGI